MAFLLRSVTGTAWADDTSDETRTRAQGDFTLRTGEDGLSFWRIDSDDDRDLVLAATVVQRKQLETVTYIEVDEATVRRFGEITTTRGTTPVETANDLHRELKWPQEQLDKLACQLKDQGMKAARKTRSQVRVLLRKIHAEALDQETRAWLVSKCGD